MPRKYPDYPYREPEPAGLSPTEITTFVQDLCKSEPWNHAPEGGPLDALCRALDLDLEYAAPPNEVMLDVPREGRPVVWLDRNSKTRYDRFSVSTALGHWMLHVQPLRSQNLDYGIQALYASTDTPARTEARIFAFELLLPSPDFQDIWFKRRPQILSEDFNLPTHLIYERAKMLLLSDPWP